MRRVFAAIVLGLFFCGPVSAQSALERLEKLFAPPQKSQETKPVPPPIESAPKPGYLGAVIDDIKDAKSGVTVLKVNPGGPADKAGLRPGDTLQKEDGEVIKNLEHLATVMGKKIPGDKIRFTIERGASVQAAEVTLGASRESSGALPPPKTNPLPPPIGLNNPLDPLGVEPNRVASRVKLGVRVVPLTEAHRQKYGLAVRRGTVVEYVSPGSLADQAGIPVGAVIVSFDGRRVDDPVELVNMVQTIRPNQEVDVNYYIGNRLHSAQLRMDGQGSDVIGAYNRPDPAPAPAQDDGKSPVLRLAERALGRLGNSNPGNEPRDNQLIYRVSELEAEVAQLKAQLKQLQDKINSKP
ncbi:MAG: PDZ domain-containing protein [Pirellulales bacterium]